MSPQTARARRRIVTAPGCLVAVACLAPYADALADETTPLPALTINGEAATTEVDVVPAGQTGSKTATPIIEIPQSISVVDADDMAARNVQSVSDALRYQAGVTVTTTAISQRFDGISIRGFDVGSTGMLRDGLRGTTAQAWPKVEPYGLEAVEVLRGPSSVLYGQNAPGGVVNQISKRPTDTAMGEIILDGGSFGRRQGRFDLGGPADDIVPGSAFRLTGLARRSDTQFDDVPDDKLFIAPAFSWSGADTRLTLLAEHAREEFGPPRPFIPLKGTLLPNPNGTIPHNQYLDEPGLKNQRTQSSAGYELEHRPDEIWTLTSAARYGRVDLLTNTASGIRLDADMRTLHRAAYRFRITGDTVATDNHAEARWQTGLATMTSLAGIDYRHTAEDYVLQGGRAGDIDIITGVSTGGMGPLTTTYADTWQTSDQLGLYLQQQARIADRWVLTLGGRQDWVRTTTDNHVTETTSRQNDQRFTWRAGAVYLGDHGLAPYAGYSTSFMPVSGTDFYGAAFKPSLADQAEIGLRFAPPGLDGAFVTAALFDLRQTNVKTTDPDNTLNTIQTGEVRSRGIEIQGGARPLPGLTLTAAWTFSDLEVTASGDATELGRRPTGLPEHSGSLRADYAVAAGPFDGLGIGAGIRYVGTSMADVANTIKVPSHTLVDASVSYELGAVDPQFSGTALLINATNLTGHDYWSSCSATSCNAGYDRQIIASLRYRW